MEKKSNILSLLEIVTPIIPAPIYWENVNSVLLGGNDAVIQGTGAKHADAYIGKSLFEIYPKEMAEHIKRHNEEVMRTGQVLSQEEAIHDITTGEFKYFTAIKAPLYDENGEIIGIIGTSIDITDRKKMEEDLKKAKEAAETADHAKTEFLANISHDIRTPLSGIVGMAEILKNEVATPIQKQHAHDLGQSGHELLNMLNEILDVVQAGALTSSDVHNAPFSIRHLIQGIINLEHPSTIVKKIELIANIAADIPPVLISDHKKIYHILLNLVGNAIKFTNAGQVEIRVSLLKRVDDVVTLKFEVIDTGKGIPPEALSKIFDRFFRVEPSYKGRDKGHGLGLHFAQSYTQLLGGQVDVTSQLDVGSTFSFVLTMNIDKSDNTITHDLDNPASIEEAPSTEGLFQYTPQILVIEDNLIALNIVDLMLKQAKFSTTAVTNGETALELATTQHFDFIFSDVGLPGISGIEFTQQLRAYEKTHHKTPVPIVGLTAHAEGKIKEECLAAGMNDVALKPLRLPTLKRIITQYALPHELEIEHTAQDEKHAEQPSKLGLDLPNTESELLNLAQWPLLNADLAIKELGNNKTLVVNMLQAFLDEQIPQEKANLEAAYQHKDWHQIEKLAHKMKGGTVYLKLTKLSTACQYMERYHKAGHRKLLEQLYRQMLATIHETIPVVNQWLQQA